MKRTSLFAALIILPVLLVPFISGAVEIDPIGSGNWYSTVPDAPWPGGVVPATNDSVYVATGISITVNSNASIAYIYGEGSIIMAAGKTLNILGDPAGAHGTEGLALLDASAMGNTIVYSGNPFWAKHQDYYNLVFSNTITTNLVDFYNGNTGGNDSFAMTVAGDMTIVGKIKVQQGNDFAIGGNLLLSTNSQWDCSSFNLTVSSNLTLGTGALLVDLDGALGANSFGGNVSVSSTAVGWNLTDVIQWSVGGNLTNNGTIVGKGYGSISFNGVGIIGGSKSIKIPTMTINGTYTIGTTITLTTNTPTLNGTLVFDLAKTNKIVLQSYPTNALTLYYSGNLEVINSGAAPGAGTIYKFFTATNYGGAFAFTSFPGLADGFSWADDLLATGSISLIGASGSPSLAVASSGGVLTLSWDSTTFPGYRVEAQTNHAGLGSSWSATGSGTVSPYLINLNPANPSVFFRLTKP